MSIIRVPKTLLPNKKVNMSNWSVIACDQFTSQKDYWIRLEQIIGDSPSCLNLIYPEVYLEQADKQARVDNINKNMVSYIKKKILTPNKNLILVERQLSDNKCRLGLMIEVDLEEYDYAKDSKSLIKATEKTVEDRLPPRIEIRQNACLEIPHIMLLMDDEKNEVLNELYAKRKSYDVLYDFELNMGGGHLIGYGIKNGQEIINKLNKKFNAQSAKDKYGDNPVLYAVGDGNHSLATAKECWNKIKPTLNDKQKANHPARFALCELVNLYDDSLQFQPIHRLIKGGTEHFIKYLQSMVGGREQIKVVFEGNEYFVNVNPYPPAAIEDIQSAIDVYLQNHPQVSIDYIHGDDNLLEVAKNENGIALFMPKIQKEQLFWHISNRGVLPRKSFSMGHAEDKRYYTEAKLIKKI